MCHTNATIEISSYYADEISPKELTIKKYNINSNHSQSTCMQ